MATVAAQSQVSGGVKVKVKVKVKVQRFDRFLSGMVMPNIGAFIAWGIITALFIPTGWIPNGYLAKWVGMCGEMAGDETAIPILLGESIDPIMTMNNQSEIKQFVQSKIRSAAE